MEKQKRNVSRSLIALVILSIFCNIMIYSESHNKKNGSYYVSANGNDKRNNGRSLETPFATLAQAMKAINKDGKDAFNTITVVGVLEKTQRVSFAYRSFHPEYYPKKIIICGLHNSSDEKKAVLSEGLYIEGGNFILENIKISGAKYRGLTIMGASVTLGKDVKISNNACGGVIIEEGTLLMTENSSICDNIAIPRGFMDMTNGAGVAIGCGTLIMQDNSSIVNNKSVYTSPSELSGEKVLVENEEWYNQTTGYGGGVYFQRTRQFGAVSGVHNYGKIILKGNAKISGNKAELSGGGIYSTPFYEDIRYEMYDNKEPRVDPFILISENAIISDNSANEKGGGICFEYRDTSKTTECTPMLISRNVKIERNKSKKRGGIYIN